MGKEGISRDDLEQAVQRVVGDSSSEIMERTQVLLLVAAVGAVGAIALSYFLGRRYGRLSSAVVEVRRL